MHLRVKCTEYSPINLGGYLAQQIFGTVIGDRTWVENQLEERKEEQIEVPQDLHRGEDKEVSSEACLTSTHTLELTRTQKSSLLGLLDEQIEAIEVEKFLEYSHHFLSVHDSLPYENLFKNT
jgi:DNA-directed RNA polymerase